MNHTTQKILVNLACVQENEEPTDILLECQEGVISAHKTILTSSSTYFQAMFNSDLKEAKTSVVIFQDVSLKAMDIIITYLYTGTTCYLLNNEELLVEVFGVAHRLLLTKLILKCAILISTQLSHANVVDIWNATEKYESKLLERRMKLFVANNMQYLLENETYLQLNANQIKKLICFVKYKAKAVYLQPDISIKKLVAFVIKWGMQFMDNEAKQEMSALIESSDPHFNFFSRSLTMQDISKWLDLNQCTLLIHTFAVNSDVLESSVYNEAEDKWSCVFKVKLRTDIAVLWYPVVFGADDKFLFGVNKSQKYVVHHIRSEELFFGPECNVVNQDFSNNAIDSEEIYFKDSGNSFVSFNFVTKTWSCLSFENVAECKKILLVTNTEVYFDCGKFMNIYSKSTNKWLKEKKPLHLQSKTGARCKCFNKKCNEKSLFFTDDFSLDCNKNFSVNSNATITIYNCTLGRWISHGLQMFHEFKEPYVPILSNCDQSLLLLKTLKSKQFHVFSPNFKIKWTSVNYPWDHDWSNIVADISFKCSCW